MSQVERRHLPSVDRVLSDERIASLAAVYPHDRLVDIIRQCLDDARQAIGRGKAGPSLDEIATAVTARLTGLEQSNPRPVINATGVILHTNLGRAPLSPEAIMAMSQAAGDYCNLEFDLATGRRGSRHAHIEGLLCQLSGAEAALAVNNNAAAVLLGLTALAKRQEIIVSRGQAVEIGGGFRIPDVMRQSGARLVEVGTTNCTYAADYRQAITPRTAALLRVHSSNFRVTGFTHEVTLEELAALGREHDLPLFDDLGSGCFLDTTAFGLAPEPLVPRSVTLGAGLVFFSGDKLVGGPQAGIIVGTRDLVDRLKKHPLARALRLDKLRLAGLAATLVHYLRGEATARIPVWRMIATPPDEIKKRARQWAKTVAGATVIAGESMIGGGSLPGGTLPTWLVAIGGSQQRSLAPKLAQQLRQQAVPVIGRIDNDMLLLDPRSVLPEEDGTVLRALQSLTTP
ncbi:MAG: L-seryl-tRNA(Sec) selenium transferase [Chloroflexota bacterium]